MRDPPCERCQGSGYLRRHLGRGTVEVTSGGHTSVSHGRFQIRKTCPDCGGSGRRKSDDI